MTAAEPKTLETKRCRYCCQRLPLKQFRRYRADREARRPECNGCHLERENERQRKSRRKTNGMVIQKSVSEIARTRSLVRFVGIVEALAERFGGADGLADEWYATFQRAQRDKRHRRAVDMMIAGLELMRAADEAILLQQKDRAALATDSELMATAISDQPEKAVQILRALGWTVSRRPEVEDEDPTE
jgi:hypothetical protein